MVAPTVWAIVLTIRMDAIGISMSSRFQRLRIAPAREPCLAMASTCPRLTLSRTDSKIEHRNENTRALDTASTNTTIAPPEAGGSAGVAASSGPALVAW